MSILSKLSAETRVAVSEAAAQIKQVAPMKDMGAISPTGTTAASSGSVQVARSIEPKPPGRSL
jgi:hypothetical protein